MALLLGNTYPLMRGRLGIFLEVLKFGYNKLFLAGPGNFSVLYLIGYCTGETIMVQIENFHKFCQLGTCSGGLNFTVIMVPVLMFFMESVSDIYIWVKYSPGGCKTVYNQYKL